MGKTSDFDVAIVAVVLAAAAFIVAFFQTLLEYLGSATARHKCAAPAIGPAYRQVKWRWSPTDWKLKVYYPLLNTDHSEISRIAAVNRDVHSASHYWSSTVERMQKNWGWRTIKTASKLTRWNVTSKLDVLHGENRDGTIGPIAIKDLDWRARFVFLWYRFRNPWRPLQLPRASWAQLLLALGIEDTQELTLRLVDADEVHANLDVPTQRISLRSLGFLAFKLGFTSVTIDAANRDFTALSPHGTITTEHINNLGKVLRFDGNILEIRSLIDHDPAIYVLKAATLISGQLRFGYYNANGIAIPLGILGQAISNAWKEQKYDDEESKFIRANSDGYAAGPILKESRVFTELLSKFLREQSATEQNTSRSRLDPDYRLNYFASHWWNTTRNTIPTIYAAAMFSTVSAIVCGFPSRALLIPFLPWFQCRASWLSRSPYLKKSVCLQETLQQEELTFTSEHSEFFMDGPEFSNFAGLYGWGFTDMKKYYEMLPDTVKSEINPSGEMTDIFAVFAPASLQLLDDFDYTKWAAYISTRMNESVSLLRPQNLLWIQTLILDISIQMLIGKGEKFDSLDTAQIEEQIQMLKGQGHTRTGLAEEITRILFGHWQEKEAQVVRAVIRFWRQEDFQENDLRDEKPQGIENQDAGLPGTNTMPSESTIASRREEQPALALATSSAGPVVTGNIQSQPPILSAVAASYPGDASSRGPQYSDLADCFENTLTIFQGESPEGRREKCKRLAHLLEARALLFIGYLLLHPDSTDVYTLEGHDIEMSVA